MIQFVYL